jgi:predicted XRE-type DNA-binding protein
MTSFQIAISPSKRAAGRFISKVRRALQNALIQEQQKNGVNQSRMATAIGVHRSVISRELNGRQDITLGRVAELAWAMGREIEFELTEPRADSGINAPLARPGALTIQVTRAPVPFTIETKLNQSSELAL